MVFVLTLSSSLFMTFALGSGYVIFYSRILAKKIPKQKELVGKCNVLCMTAISAKAPPSVNIIIVLVVAVVVSNYTNMCADIYMQFVSGILLEKWMNSILARSVIVINRPNVYWYPLHNVCITRKAMYLSAAIERLWRLLITRFHLGKYLLWSGQTW